MEKSLKRENTNFILLLIRRSFFSLRRSNVSLFIAFLGISIGIFSLIAITSTMNGMQNILIDELLKVEAYDYQGTSSFGKKNSIIKTLEENKTIEVVVPFLDDFAIMNGNQNRGSEQRLVNLRALDFKQMNHDTLFFEGLYISTNRANPLLQKSNINDAFPPIILGFNLSGLLGVRIGDVITITPAGVGAGFLLQPTKVVVSDIFSNGGDYDTNWAFMRLDDYISLSNTKNNIIQYGIRVNSHRNIIKTLSPQLDDVQPWQERHRALYIALKSEKFMLIILSVVIFFIIVLHFRFAMIRRIRNKKDDIVSLRAIGAVSKQIALWFLGETVIIGILGTIVGTGLGLGFVFYSEVVENIFTSIFGIMINMGNIGGSSISIIEIGTIVGFTWILMGISLWQIIQNSTKITPMQVLRYE